MCDLGEQDDMLKTSYVLLKIEDQNDFSEIHRKHLKAQLGSLTLLSGIKITTSHSENLEGLPEVGEQIRKLRECIVYYSDLAHEYFIDWED